MSGMRASKRRLIATAPVVAPMQLAGATGPDALAKLERGLSEVAEAFNASAGSAYTADVDLVVGQNTINHGLDRTPEMVTVTPASAVSSFGWGWDPEQPGNPRPEQITQVQVTGVPMRVRIEVR